MAIKRFCDGVGCGKEIQHVSMVIPKGVLLENHMLKIRLDYADGSIYDRCSTDFCRDCLVKAVNAVEGA